MTLLQRWHWAGIALCPRGLKEYSASDQTKHSPLAPTGVELLGWNITQAVYGNSNTQVTFTTLKMLHFPSAWMCLSVQVLHSHGQKPFLHISNMYIHIPTQVTIQSWIAHLSPSSLLVPEVSGVEFGFSRHAKALVQRLGSAPEVFSGMGRWDILWWIYGDLMVIFMGYNGWYIWYHWPSMYGLPSVI